MNIVGSTPSLYSSISSTGSLVSSVRSPDSSTCPHVSGTRSSESSTCLLVGSKHTVTLLH